MRNILTILSRELNYYFLSPLGYIVMTCFLLLNGILFYILINILNQPEALHGSVMKIFFGGTLFFWLYLLIFIPVITMKLLAEEHSSGTIEPLMTVPVREREIILGKFFGALLFYILLWVPTLIYLLIISGYSKINAGPVISGYLGVILIGSMFISIGLLCSTLTGSQVSAAIISFAVLTLFFLSGLLEELARGQLVKDIISYINLFSIMDNFSKGIINSKNLVYTLSITFGTLFINIKIMQSRKWV